MPLTPQNPSLSLCSRFGGSGAMLLEIDFGPFLSHCLTIFWLRSGSKNIVKYSVVFVAYRNYILQHGENCANTSAFARHRHKNIVNTVILLPDANKKKHRKYRGFGLPRRKKNIGMSDVFCSEGFKNTRKHRLFDGL